MNTMSKALIAAMVLEVPSLPQPQAASSRISRPLTHPGERLTQVLLGITPWILPRPLAALIQSR